MIFFDTAEKYCAIKCMSIMDNGVGNSMHWADTGFIEQISCIEYCFGDTAYDITCSVTYLLRCDVSIVSR